MSRAARIMLSVILFLSGCIPFATSQHSKKWTAGHYESIVVGKSTKQELAQQLGAPRNVGREQDTGIATLTYEISSPVPGRLTAYIVKGVVDGITIEPSQRLAEGDALKLFGSDGMRVRYAAADCLT
jgi:hypothetical protein